MFDVCFLVYSRAATTGRGAGWRLRAWRWIGGRTRTATPTVVTPARRSRGNKLRQKNSPTCQTLCEGYGLVERGWRGAGGGEDSPTGFLVCSISVFENLVT